MRNIKQLGLRQWSNTVCMNYIMPVGVVDNWEK